MKKKEAKKRNGLELFVFLLVLIIVYSVSLYLIISVVEITVS